MTRLSSRIIVTVVFAVFYLAFLVETGALLIEFGPERLGIRMATLFAHNFLFFPIVGFLALVAFWRPTVLIVDALLWGKVKLGQATLAAVVLVVTCLSVFLSSAFGSSNARSLFEVSPAALTADRGVMSENDALRRASVQEILVKMKINALSEGGLSEFQSNCDAEWLQFAVAADEQKLCFPTGTIISVKECCAARTRFREFINASHAAAPSDLAGIHRLIIPFKMTFLLTLLAVGILLVRLRKRLTHLYGAAVQNVSFPIAVGGALMLLWPLMNASYLDTFSLLTSDGSSNVYRVTAPLYALGFGIWSLLLIFFHLRTYPSQMEIALKGAGALAAVLGVLQYEQIIAYLSRTLGIGGGIVAVVVFIVGIAALVASVMLGHRPEFLDPPAPEEETGRSEEAKETTS
ncbi:MAG: hypothetical protein QNI84_02915 [Henriciella sp.]|nr:hypothetical protein [Henriciella sp.]